MPSTRRRNVCAKTTADPVLEASLKLYAEWVAEAEEESQAVRSFRQQWPLRYMELCKLHLAVLIDLPTDFANDTRENLCEGEANGARDDSNGRKVMISWPRLRFASHSREPDAKLHSGGRNRSVSSTRCGNEAIAKNIMVLIDLLDTEEYVTVEGIFRKPGNVARQRILRQRILNEKNLTSVTLIESTETRVWKPAGRVNQSKVLRKWPQTQMSKKNHQPDASEFTVHDYASCLKSVLYDLPEPLLTNKLLPLFVQVAGLTVGRFDDKGNRINLRPIEEKIASAKQLKALRLLCLLLPESHAKILRRMLVLLQHVLDHSSTNRMTAESLGTLFSPSILSPSKISPWDLQTQYQSFAKLVAMMISQGVNGLWKLPKSFSTDLDRNRLLIQTPSSSRSSKSRTNRSDQPDSDARSHSTDSGIEGSRPTSIHEQSVPMETPESLGQELPPLVTCINFSVRSALDSQTVIRSSPDRTETQFAVAELCASIQSLSEHDPRKRRLVQRFNAKNGGLYPPKITLSRDPIATVALDRSIYLDSRNLDSPFANPDPFVRPNGNNSAFKAAKVIRSSLRRRLAIRSNVSISNFFRSPTNNEKPVFEIALNGKHPTVTSNDRRSVYPLQKMQSSPILDAPVDVIVDGKESYRLSRMTKSVTTSRARISLVSVSSISSTAVPDMLFCCPLVEAITSPFRKKSSSTSHLKQSSAGSSSTPITRCLRGGLKRIRYRSPSPPSLKESTAMEDEDEDEADEVTYCPVCFPMEAYSKAIQREPESPERTAPPVNHSSTPLQRNLLSYGFRTVAHKSMNLTINESTKLRRSHTMSTLPRV